ncbi:MAG TPA: 50S ribosomal protein L15 [Candidatus Limnocylindria bacterium]|nr:50S ribosomal protein L15 [Candidatus Limnocylindria bacterium]
MKLHDLQPPSGSHKAARRVGRGHGSGRGKTAGRGTKGQKSRAGSSIPAWFEGGQTPLHVRTPKLHGFKNRFRVEYAGLNLARLSDVAAGTLVTPDVLRHDGLLRRSKTRLLPVKILGGGDAPKGVTIHAHAFTRSALEKLQAAGSTAQRISWPDGLPIDEAAEAKEAAAAEASAEAKAEKRAAKAGAKAVAKGGSRKSTPDETAAEGPAEAAAVGAPADEATADASAPVTGDSDDATQADEDDS